MSISGKLLCLLLGAMTCSACPVRSQKLGGFLDKLKKDATAATTSSSAAGIPLSNSEMVAGLKEALQKGVEESVRKVSAVNGYFGDPLIKILFPPEARKVESALRKIGLNQLCDNVILSLNRAAEKAAGEAAPVFLDALQQMTLQDASSILLGDDTAATAYFKNATTAALTSRFRPVIDSSLSSVGATTYWTEVMQRYNKLPFVQPVNPDLSAYVTGKAISGLFMNVAEKEKQIRTQLGARTSPLLKKVFGYAEQAKNDIPPN